MADNDLLGSLAGRIFAAVLFDMDGTLIDSTPAVERSWLRWAEEFDVELGRFGSRHGIPAAQLVATFLPEEQRAAGTRRIEQIETEDVEGIVVLPGAAEALAVLAAAPVRRSAIATSCVRELAQARIGAAGLVPPAVLVTADMVKVGKPDPEPFLLAAQKLGFDAADCLVVEDAPAGLTSGREAGAARLAVTTTHTADQLDAEAVVQNLAAVRFEVTADGVRVHAA